MLRIDSRTLGYAIREEMQREKLRGRAGMRTLGCEEKLREGKGNELAKLCWEEVLKKADMKEAGSIWEKKKKKFLEDKGIRNKKIEEGKSGEGDWFERAIKVERKKQRDDRWERIGNSNYNK